MHRHGGVRLDGGEDVMLFERVEEAHLHVGALREVLEREVAALILARSEVRLLGKNDRLTVGGFELERITLHDVRREHDSGGLVPDDIRLLQECVKDFSEVVSAFFGVVGKQLDAVHTHECEQCIVIALELALAVALLHRRELALQNRHQEIARPTRRFKKTRVDALSFIFDEVEHVVHEPARRKHLAVI